MAFVTLRAQRGPKQRSAARADVQGLRAFAVVVVVLDHLFEWPRGGFIGVDVFFVISGFLITGLLLREHDRSGTISWGGFYKRRVKRIMPAAVLVLAITVPMSYVAFNGARAESVRTDSIWALLFSANWRFLSQATDYFNADGPVSPLQHYWSLSVEEQFYFVWPWVMLGLLASMASRSARSRRIAVLGLITVLSGLSFAWALLQSSSNPDSAYFSTLTRAWELGLGAMLAVAAPMLHRIPDAIRPALAWAGLAGMVSSLWLVSTATTFPAPGAALPVLAAGLYLAAGTHADRAYQQPMLWPMTNPGSVYLGDISYSLYIWHFPVIVLGEEFLGGAILDKVLLAVAIATLSIFAFHLVEDPLRKASWSTSGRDRRQPLGSVLVGPVLLTRSWQLTFLAFAVSATAVLSVVVLQAPKAPKMIDLALPPASATSTASPSAGASGVAAPSKSPRQAALTADLVAALQSDAWPEGMEASMTEAIGSQQAPPEFTKCGAVEQPLTPDACVFGAQGAKKRAAIIGDSVSMTYSSPLATVLAGQKEPWSLTVMGTFGCPFRDVDPSLPDGAGCENRKASAVRAIKEMRPEILFVVDSYWPTPLTKGADAPTPVAWAERLSQSIALVSGSVEKIVLMAAPPSPFNPGECFTPRSSPADCAGKIPGMWEGMANAERGLADQVDGQWVSSADWFCAYGQCPAYAGKTPVKSDLTHMTVEYGKKIEPVLAESLRSQQVLSVKGSAS